VSEIESYVLRLAKRVRALPIVQEFLAPFENRRLIISADRLDYSKGILPRLKALDHFLIHNPDLRRKVALLQITPVTRPNLSEYATLRQQIDRESSRINNVHGEISWKPVHHFHRTFSRTLLAGLYRAAELALVTPFRDGMNLVSKEYVMAQDPERPGVLILSSFAGAAVECEGALLIDPHDPVSIGMAIAEGFSMPLHERRERYRATRDVLMKNDIKSWGDRFFTRSIANAGVSGRFVRRRRLTWEPGFMVQICRAPIQEYGSLFGRVMARRDRG
jgi:trehalose 6-phosphate synthase